MVTGRVGQAWAAATDGSAAISAPAMASENPVVLMMFIFSSPKWFV
jgi:hypothetical protein